MLRRNKKDQKSQEADEKLPTLPTDLPQSPFQNVDVDIDLSIYEKGDKMPNAEFPDVFGAGPQQPSIIPQQSPISKTTSSSSSGTNKPVVNLSSGSTATSNSHVNIPKSSTTTKAVQLSNGTPASMSSTSVASLRESVRSGISLRSEFPLIRSKVALLVIDVQKMLSSPSSDEEAESYEYLYQHAVPHMLTNTQALVQAFRTQRDTKPQGCEVLFTFLQAATSDRRDISLDYKLSGPTLANIPGPLQDELFLDEVKPDLQLGKGDILIPKTSCSVFASTNIDYMLRNLHTEQLVICGQLTNQCVESAVRDAADAGYFVTVVQDACAANSADAHAKGLHGTKGFCRIVDTQQILSELERDDQSLPAIPASLGAARSSDGMIAKTKAPLSGSALAAFIHTQEKAYTSALLYSLKCAGVEFLRYYVVDVCNTIRCKAATIDQLMRASNLNYQISIATVVVAGLPSFADVVTEGSGLDARNVLIVQPDLATLRVLPYAPKSALVLGNLHDPLKGGTLSELCTRGLLQKVSRTAREDFQLELCVGAELEFCLHDAKTGKPVDNSIFCNSTTLNQQEDFISDLYRQLREQQIPVEAFHAESAPGQLEVVLRYQTDPVLLVDCVVLVQETIRAVSRAHVLKAIFLPKIHPLSAGNGLHLHLSFNDMKSGQNALSSIGSLSSRGESFVEGILQHLPGLLGLTMPTVNSFRRVGPGCWTGSRVTWALEDKESPMRVCSSLFTKEWQHVEYKLCDSYGNLYLGLAAICLCGLDGIRKELSLRPPSQGEDAEILLPASLEKSLECLEQDDLLMQFMGSTLSKSYLALRRSEASRSSTMALEVQHALNMS